MRGPGTTPTRTPARSSTRAGRGPLRADDEAFRRMFVEYYPRLVSTLQRRGRDPETAQDIAQQTFVRVFRFFDRYDPDSPAWPWLQTIAWHESCSLARRRGRQPPADALDEPADDACLVGASPDPGDPADGVIDRVAVGAALDRVNERYRTALVLHYVDDRPVTDIAERLHSSADAAKQLLWRARESFRQHYLDVAC